jgi:hypothetical protein
MITGATTRDLSYPPVGILARDGVHPCFFSNPRAGAGYVERFASSPDRRIGSISHTVRDAFTGCSNRESEGVSICKVLHAWFDPRASVFSGIFTLDALNGNLIYFSTLGGTEKFVYQSGLALCLLQRSAHVNGLHSNGYTQIGALASSSTLSMRQRRRSDRTGFRSWRAVRAGGRRGFAILESCGLQFTAGMGTAVVTTDSV